MATYKRFEDLPVWQAAIDLAHKVYELTEHAQFRSSLRDQMERAALSVPNNIAEGFERGTTSELLNFLYIARGSCGELRSMLSFVERLPALQDLKSQISNLKSEAERVSRQLRGWADALQNSEIKGQRHLTEKSRRLAEQKRAREKFLVELKAITEQGRAERTSNSDDEPED